MKVYIYDELILDPSYQAINDYFKNSFHLQVHFDYLIDIYETLKPYQTSNPEEADLFFVPLFILGWQFANIDPAETIEKHCGHLFRGKHILLSTGDFGQREESDYELKATALPNRAYKSRYQWLDNRFLLLVFESTDTLLPQDIAILPYQMNDIATENYPRDIFASFSGAVQHPYLPPSHIRGGRLSELRKIDPNFLIGTPDELNNAFGRKISFHELMSRSVFTLCPAGYGRWTFRLIEALLCGSIPVIISDGYVLPFADKINWDKYVIRVPEIELANLPILLKSIPQEQIGQMLKNILDSNNLFKREFTVQCLLNRLALASMP
jgi:Exostosin family